MKMVGTTGLKVTGYKESELAKQLEFFHGNSKTAEKLIKQTGKNGVEIKVSQTGNTCHAVSDTEVQLDWTDCHQDIKELSESALFELNNALNYKKIDDLDWKWKYNKLSILEYGYDFAAHESPSSTIVFSVLGELGGSYTPSTEFGESHIEKNKQAIKSNKTIADVFADSKHNKNYNNGKLSLKSKYLYAYERFDDNKAGKNLKSARSKLKKITTAIIPPKKSPINLTESKFTQLINKFNNDYVPDSDGQALRNFFAAYILGLQELTKSGWTISWDNKKGNWLEFAREIERVDGNVFAMSQAVANGFKQAYP